MKGARAFHLAPLPAKRLSHLPQPHRLFVVSSINDSVAVVILRATHARHDRECRNRIARHVDHFAVQGVMDPDLLYQRPVADEAPQGSESISDDVNTSRVSEVIEALDRSAVALLTSMPTPHQRSQVRHPVERRRNVAGRSAVTFRGVGSLKQTRLPASFSAHRPQLIEEQRLSCEKPSTDPYRGRDAAQHLRNHINKEFNRCPPHLNAPP